MNQDDLVDAFQPEWPSFVDFFFSRRDGSSICLIELNHDAGSRREWSVDDWQRLVSRTARALVAHGIGRTSCVAVLLANRAEALAVAYACWLLGACYVPLSGHDSRERQRFILADCNPTLVVCQPVDFGDFSSTTYVTRSFDDVIALADDRGVMRSFERVGLDVDALRVYTSGTTGEPKGVILTALNLLIDCDALALGTGWGTDTRVITVLPIHHVNGLVISNLLVWYVGATTILCDRFRSDRFWIDVEAEAASTASLVPSILEFLLQDAGDQTGLLDEVLCGASPLLSATALEFEAKFSIPVRHLFGMSETTAVVTLMPRMSADARATWHAAYGPPSIGPALPHAQVTVVTSNGTEAGEGELGELAVRGGMVMRAYAGQSESAGEWLMTGDEGFWHGAQDGTAYFFVTGRLKEIIIRGGMNISPVEIDAVIRRHPNVKFGLAVAFANRFYGEEVAAYVVRDGELTEDELIDHCAQYLDFALCPKVVVFGDSIPFTSTGKPKRIELARTMSQELGAHHGTQFRRSGRAKSHVSEESATIRTAVTSSDGTAQ